MELGEVSSSRRAVTGFGLENERAKDGGMRTWKIDSNQLGGGCEGDGRRLGGRIWQSGGGGGKKGRGSGWVKGSGVEAGIFPPAV